MARKVKPEDFLKEISALAADMRKRIEAEVDGFDPDPRASRQRRRGAENDFRYFCATYFPHHVKGEPSAFHAFLFERLPEIAAAPEGQRDLIAAPRGNAKSTYASQLFVLWCLLTGRKRYAVLISDSFDQAAVLLEGIKAELEANPRLAADFPEHCGAGPTWQVGVAVTASGAKLQAAGSGKKLRGFRHGAQRPDIVILDDIENDENVRTPEQRDKLEQWVDKAVDPLGPPDGSMDIIFVNTFLHHDAVAKRKSRNPMWRSVVFKAVIRWPDRTDLWDRWEEVLRNDGREAADAFHAEHRAEMEAGSQVLWPAVQPLKKLMEIRVRVGRQAFDSEYQNDPLDEAAALFANLTFWVNRLPEWVFIGVCDPSLGKNNRRSDPSAILVGGFSRETGVLDVVEADIRRRVPDRIIEDVIRYHQEYRTLKFGVEVVQFQEFLRTELVKRSAARGFPVPAVPIHNSTDKALRIESLQPHVANQLIRFHPSHATLLEQLRHFPQADHDDGPDALEMLWRLAQTVRASGGLIRTGGRRSMARGGFRAFIGG
ncbi:MAG: phage terminase large subunit [Pseudomonadota bacterium]